LEDAFEIEKYGTRPFVEEGFFFKRHKWGFVVLTDFVLAALLPRWS
jgi:hypothetical protein